MTWSLQAVSNSAMADAGAMASVLAVLITLVGILASSPGVARVALQVKVWRAKAPVVRHLRRHGRNADGDFHPRRESWKQARAITQGVPYTLADELQWLTETLKLKQPFSFDPHQHTHLEELAEHYRRYTINLRLRSLFGGNQPLLEHAAKVSRAVVSVLESNADSQDINLLSKVEARSVTRQITTGYISAQPGADLSIPSLVRLNGLEVNNKISVHHLQVSWLKELSNQPRPRATAVGGARDYNGLLPKLRKHRFERDLSTGNYRLHLDLGEIYYRNYLELRRPRSVPAGAELGQEASLLTLAVLPITCDGHIILAQRGTAGVYPGCWGPGAGGNLEIPRSGRPNPDADADGIINPLRAVAREAREEIGLHLDIERIQSLGLSLLSNAEEHGTWLLPTMTTVPLTVDELAKNTINADMENGRWEVGNWLAAVPLPQDPQSTEILVSWCLRNKQVMPHLAASLILLTSFYSETSLGPHPVAPRDSDAEELPPGAHKFRFGGTFAGTERTNPALPR